MKWFKRKSKKIPKLSIPRGVRYTIDVDMRDAGDEVHRLVMSGHKRRVAIRTLAEFLASSLTDNIEASLIEEMKRRAKKGRT